MPIRRSRGEAPRPIELPVQSCKSLLATGGQHKSTFALGRGGAATISHHLGDLDHFAAFQAFERDVALYEEMFVIRPEAIIHDMHPDYASTRYALRRGREEGIECIAVQHHHAHMASCMAENGLTGHVIGVCFDGTGFGPDGTIWGGEFLTGGYESFQRAGHLRQIRMPGGEAAVREPWRMALAYLRDAGVDAGELERRVDRQAFRAADSMLARGFNSPKTSSAGRLFDAAASLAGAGDVAGFEAQSAMRLEWMAADSFDEETYPVEWSADGEIDSRPLIRAIAADAAKGTSRPVVARRFHNAVVELILLACRRIGSATGLDRVVLSGGVFLNGLLSELAAAQLDAAGFHVFRHWRVPPSDGGISLGQLCIGHSLIVKERVKRIG